MNLITRVTRKPAPYLIDFVRAVVIDHQMHVEAARNNFVDLIEKAQKLLMPVSPVTTAEGEAR